ncbi:uncharacterized protein LOC128712412 [Anopheles marshallii]|uniref:uncharacterized protein LOC128712412 n=1 Tax=Anopheles marshallii TaxID=1521116 RepID=UPI00237B9777|nr:uncharacterized protein LOC128712412 [Anopheles marshallii]
MINIKEIFEEEDRKMLHYGCKIRSGSNVFWMLALGLLLLASVLGSDAANNPRSGLQKPAAVANQQGNRLQAPSTKTKLVSDSVTNLAARIANALSNQKSKTEIFSPVSIAGALSLLLLGSGGQTQQELLKVMGLDKGQLSFQEIHVSFGRLFQDLVSNDPSLEPLVTWRLNDKCNRYDEEEDDEEFLPAQSPSNPNEYPSHQISVANGLFLQKDLKPIDRYLQLTQRIYQGTVNNLDFERDANGAAAFINKWCSDATKGKITEIVTEDLLYNTRMIVANALYFKAQWETTFSPFGTRKRSFYPNGRLEPAISVESMATSGCFPYYNATNEYDVEIIGLPYETGKSTMYIILPNGSNRQKIQEKLAVLNAAHLNWLIDRMIVKKGMVVLPKLNISNRIHLGSILQRLGIRDLFDPQRSNLTEMFNDKRATDSTDTSNPSEPIKPLNTQNRLDVTEPPKYQTSTQNPIIAPVRQNTAPRPQTPQQALPQPRPPTNAVQDIVSFNTTAHDCNLIENCGYTARTNECTCNRIPTEERNPDCGAHIAKHYYDDKKKRNCLIGFTASSLTTHICLKPNYQLNLELRTPAACEQRYECKMFKNLCYCCNSNVALQQPQTQNQAGSNSQPMVVNRFGGDDAVYPNQPVYSNVQPKITCYRYAQLFNSYICQQYGFQWDAVQNVCFTCTTSSRIQKRQAPFLGQPAQGTVGQSRPQVQQTPYQQLLDQPELPQQQFQTRLSQQSAQQQQPIQRQQQGTFQPQTVQQQQQQSQQTQRQRPAQQQQNQVQRPAQQQPQQQPRQPQRQPYGSVHVNEIITQVTLDVNEQGTEGGAVTAALIDRIGPGYSFVVDGPFMIFIRHDQTQLPLFYGAVYDPRYPSDYDPSAHLITLANGIFVERNFQLSDTYRNQSMMYYSSEVQSLDFELNASGATQHINGWVSEKTHGKIPNILASTLHPSTVMVLASALYFKALWAETFIDGATKLREFYPDGKDKPSVMVEMMAHGGCFPFYESAELDARIIGLPYKNNLTTMYVIMPNDSNRVKLQRLIPKLNGDKLNQLIDSMSIKTSIILFPKMHISNTVDLKRVLQQLGVSSMFRAERSNLSAMLNEEPEQTDSYPSRVQEAVDALAPAKRPALNIPTYDRRPTSEPWHDRKEILIFNRISNATVDEPAVNSTEQPPTTETVPQTLVPLTPSPSRTGRHGKTKRDVSYKVPSSKHAQAGPLSSKDFILNKRIVKENGPVGKKGLRRRSKRAAGQLYVSNAVHQVDLEVNETGTEGGAATIVTLNRSGTSVVFRAEAPFLLLIRNDRTDLPLFYGPIYHPTS